MEFRLDSPSPHDDLSDMHSLEHAVAHGQYDLTQAFEQVAINDPRLGLVVQALRSLEAVTAIHEDLREAKRAMETAARLAPSLAEADERPEDQLVVEALFVHAVMLYCRAVHSGSKTRKRMDVVGSFSPEVRRAHLEVTALRDGVIAHYGPGASYPGGGRWTQDHVVLHRRPHGFAFSYPSLRAATKGSVNQALTTVIEAATKRVLAYGTEKQDRLMLVLRERFAADPSLKALVEGSPFDEIGFFGHSNPPGLDGLRLTVAAGAPLRASRAVE
ncbi:MAG: hypothetical protein KKE02_14700 [Alphaproteobacteria bacterium]|nr:hypothetical protein [Alphaproteobacteria bacterium]MBU1513243.1 hypothetical protein [Alphaproteobacteria bacterium]MBU2095351.1 hypothetical protein [Alphaproteobacteria bacterium]MBU2152266.1 hypothetical protein [Alphaproteobacteria bacterium]MBU2306687.1 hypothetical protein [Alphaproteobacteria bacterium]